jgi:siroheme synthase (precorrin-2 oxidase/ferrochelatase)
LEWFQLLLPEGGIMAAMPDIVGSVFAMRIAAEQSKSDPNVVAGRQILSGMAEKDAQKRRKNLTKTQVWLLKLIREEEKRKVPNKRAIRSWEKQFEDYTSAIERKLKKS